MKQNFRTIQLPLFIWTGMMILFSSLPGNKLPAIVSFWQWDKVAHGVEYFVFTVLLFRFFVLGRHCTPEQAFWFCLGIGILYAALDELHQLFIPQRECTIYDFTADAAGILSGAIASWQYFRKRFVHEAKVTA
jgi:VanZ family protein